MRKLLDFLRKNNSRVLLGNLLASFFGLLNFMLMVRMTSKSDFGQIVIFLSAAGLADLIRTGFVRQGLVRHWVADENKDKRALIGSAWLLHLAIALLLITLCKATSLVTFLFHQSGLNIFFYYYPILLLASVPHQMTSWIAQASKSYVMMNVFRLAVNVLFFFVLILNYEKAVSSEKVIFYLILCHAAVSLVALVFFNTLKHMIHLNRKLVLSLIKFGKYSLSTLAGSNLLKSTDTLLIGLLINPESAAVYAIPFKVIELLEIPLRGFVMTSFHTLTRLYQNGNASGFSQHFAKNAVRLSCAFTPIAIFCLLFPSLVINLLGGAEYTDSLYVLRVLSLAMLLLPMDKYVGMALDSIDKPDQNAKKVWLMVLVNGIGDLLVILLGGPLWMIAAMTVLNISLGVVYGALKNHFLNLIPAMKSSIMRVIPNS